MYQGSNAWRQVHVLFVSLASVNVLSSKSTQREVISLSRRSASGEGVSTCRVSNSGMRRSSYRQHMISPQAAPMRCARRDVVAAWNVDVCQNTACRDLARTAHCGKRRRSLLPRIATLDGRKVLPITPPRQKWMLPTAKKEKKIRKSY